MLGLKTLARGHKRHVQGLAREAGVGIEAGKRLLDAARNPQAPEMDNAADLELDDLRDRRDAASRCMYLSFLIAVALLFGLLWLSATTGNRWMILHAVLWSAILAMYGWRMLIEEERLANAIQARRRARRPLPEVER